MKQHLKIIRPAIRKKCKQKKDLKDFANIINSFLRSPASKYSFDLIKRLSLLNPKKRDGSVMQCFIQDDLLKVGEDEVNANCLHVLSQIS